MFLQVCVCPQGGRWVGIPACIAGGIPACLATGLQGVGMWPRGMPGLGGLLRGGVPGLGGLLPGGCLVGGCLVQGGAWSGGCLVWGVPGPGGLVSQHGLRQTSGRDGYYCRQYASHWNAFLLKFALVSVSEQREHLYTILYKPFFIGLCISLDVRQCKHTTGWEWLIRSHSLARFSFELSGNSNKSMPCNSNFHHNFELEISLN